MSKLVTIVDGLDISKNLADITAAFSTFLDTHFKGTELVIVSSRQLVDPSSKIVLAYCGGYNTTFEYNAKNLVKTLMDKTDPARGQLSPTFVLSRNIAYPCCAFRDQEKFKSDGVNATGTVKELAGNVYFMFDQFRALTATQRSKPAQEVLGRYLLN